MKIIAVVPTIRKEQAILFKQAWKLEFDKWNIELVFVWDGDEPKLDNGLTAKKLLGKKNADLIYNKTRACCNLGFYYAIKQGADVVLSFDDDVRPLPGSIKGHLDILGKKTLLDWQPTMVPYTRGIPYAIRGKDEVVLSHGMWSGIYDYDASTFLVNGNRFPTEIYKGIIKRGINFPFCGMNVAFLRKAAPYVYHWPSGYPRTPFMRNDDIWLGVYMKRKFDKINYAIATGFSYVLHEKASNTFDNIEREANSMRLTDELWRPDFVPPAKYADYFKESEENYERWIELLSKEI